VHVIAFARIVLLLLADLVALVRLAIRPRQAIAAENLVLRRQLSLYKERGVTPRRLDAATRVTVQSKARFRRTFQDVYFSLKGNA